MLAVYAATRNLYWYLPTTIGSLLRHNPDWRVLVYCEDDAIDTLDDPRVSFVNMNNVETLIKNNNPNANTHFGPFTLIRCYLPKFLPNESKVLWIDVDTCITESLKELDLLDLTGKAVAGVMENHQPVPGAPLDFQGIYINAGVLLMNLDFIREQKFDDVWLNLLSTRIFNYPDQDAINLTCKGYVTYLNVEYNYSPSTIIEVRSNPKIIHYTYQKIWDNPNVIFWRQNYIKKLGEEPELK